MTSRIVGLVLCLISAFAVGAGATPIHYDEGVSGDLPNQGPYTLLPLDIGLNTVSGSQYLPGVPVSGDFDNVAFTVPSGTFVTNITYATTLTSGGPGQVIYELTNGNGPIGPPLGYQPIAVGTSSPMFSTAMPLGAGTYSLFNGGMSGPLVVGWTDTYIWTLDVEPQAAVPDTVSTASLLLLGTGLLGLAHSKLRSRAVASTM
jgi:hypothetical protein